MGKINCPQCGEEISDTVRKCPNCNFDKISSYLLQLENQKIQKYIDYTSFHNEEPITTISSPKEQNILKCPTCDSTNIRKMGGVEHGASIAAFGIFSKKINKTFKCGNCGYTW